MGSLTVTIGAVNASLNFTNAKGAAIINGFIAAQGGPVGGTDQERLDWFVAQLGVYVRDRHRRKKLEAATEAALVATEAGMENWT